MARPDLGFDGSDLAPALGDSCGLLAAFFGNLNERAAVAVQRGLAARDGLPPGNYHVHVLGVQLDAPANAFSDLRGGQGRPRSEEGLVASLPTPCVIQQRTPHQIYRFLSWVIVLLLVGAARSEERRVAKECR